jgi:hypothetical protein
MVAVKSLGFALALAAALPAIAAETADEQPHSCRLLGAETGKCVFGSCDGHLIQRLQRECTRDRQDFGNQKEGDRGPVCHAPPCPAEHVRVGVIIR